MREEDMPVVPASQSGVQGCPHRDGEVACGCLPVRVVVEPVPSRDWRESDRGHVISDSA